MWHSAVWQQYVKETVSDSKRTSGVKKLPPKDGDGDKIPSYRIGLRQPCKLLI